MKTDNIEPSGQHAAAATRGSRSTNLAGAKGMIWRDASTESVGQIRDMTVVGAEFIDNDDGTGILAIGGVDGTGLGGILPGGDADALYVNVSTGNDTSGDGTSGTPYASIGRALEDIPTIIDRAYTIDVADGTYYEQVNIDRFVFLTYLDGVTDARIVLDGNTTTPANCIISGATSGATTTPSRTMCIWVRNNARVVIQGFKLQYAVVRGLQVDYYSTVTLGKMEYANGDGFLVGLHSLVLLAGNQTIGTAATGIYLTEFGRLNTDAGSRTITMTGITLRGLYVVESTMLLNTGDVLSITAHSSGTRTAGIEGDGISTTDLPVSVTVSGAFGYGVIVGGGAHLHLASASLTISGYATAAYLAADLSTVWDATNSKYLAGAPPGYQFDAVSITSSVTVSATSAATATTVVTGNAVTYNGSDSILIEFACPYFYLSTNTAGKGLYLWLYDGTSEIGNLSYQDNTTTTDLYTGPKRAARFLTPSAAAHTYSIRASKDSGGTTVMQVAAGAGGSGAAMPAFIRITKV